MFFVLFLVVFVVGLVCCSCLVHFIFFHFISCCHGEIQSMDYNRGCCIICTLVEWPPHQQQAGKIKKLGRRRASSFLQDSNEEHKPLSLTIIMIEAQLKKLNYQKILWEWNKCVETEAASPRHQRSWLFFGGIKMGTALGNLETFFDANQTFTERLICWFPPNLNQNA